MNWIIENWYIIISVLAVIIGVFVAIAKFIGLPTATQIAKVKEWLLWATAKAEKELGSGTGQLKLRYVYDMFVEKFPIVAKLITFEYFSKLVDEALEKLNELLMTNMDINRMIKK